MALLTSLRMPLHLVSVFWLVASSSDANPLTLPCHTPSDSQATRINTFRVQGLFRAYGESEVEKQRWAHPGVCRPVYLVKGILNGPQAAIMPS